MTAAPVVVLSRSQTLRALGITPLRLRARNDAAATVEPIAGGSQNAPAVLAGTASSSARHGNRIALARASMELHRPELAELSAKLTEAISKLGMQCVRIADAERDECVRVLAFGDVEVPATIEEARVLRVDALATLHADRTRKRALWEMLQGLVREAGSG
ncbi:MAG: hypothetical protein ABI132_06610 [Rhodanobacteraceae bacterium]